MNKRRVVITGMGCVTALGETADTLYENVCSGKSGVSPIERFDTTDYPVRFGGEVKTFNPDDYINHREAKRLDPFSQYAVASAITAAKDSGIEFDEELALRSGVIIGTGIGGIIEIEAQHIRLLEKGPGKVSPFCVPKLMGNAASGNVSIQLGIKGPNMCVISACASAAHAMGESYNQIAFGRADVVVTGGSEAAVSPVGLASFCALRSLSTRNDDPEKASRPFDVERDGFVLSEGAGVLIFEEYEHAVKRGAKIYAEVLGYAATGDAHHITAPLPDGSGAARGMKLAMQDAQVNPDEIDYINAHGTSTELNDIAETMAIQSVFGDHAKKVALSSTKSCTGHLLGASAAVEMIITAKTIEKGIIPLTANTTEVDEKCGPDMNHVIGESRQQHINIAASNSLGFGGHNATLIIGRV
ncbi:3-oxoacyl-[acyl-carrier-protein] synthase 2 [Limihaloglobus sulfuriphilus]|uniref:3-oxoacyl-[acyl-carrier-protein] synthase 2 n=1 Tax=Limihaloglobus sulfuriphilus TaxID=1851148 RepID=A0A1Q2MGZ6_9BACT|nr:beta-ketoacyl-ACP synthase II [Limihaloglobus sulfuriphilus]AQQ71808.1 3-oxoacyl-[acyl-carrier-protein] synthase 2 [Limihaloglobus sulfuriphilus]